MNALVLAADALGVGAMVLMYRRNLRASQAFFEARLREQDEAKQATDLALYKQQKAMARTVAQSDRAVRKLADQTRALQEDTRLTHQRTDALARDVKGAH